MSSTYFGFLTLQYVVIIPAILEYVRRETQMLVDLKTYITHLRTREFKQIRNCILKKQVSNFEMGHGQ